MNGIEQQEKAPPTEEQLKAALMKAHKAGDSRAAELFARKIKELRTAPEQGTEVRPSEWSIEQQKVLALTKARRRRAGQQLDQPAQQLKPERLKLLLEAERRGILPPDKKALLDEARRRGLVSSALPKGFVLDAPKAGAGPSAALPPGFVLDGPKFQPAASNPIRLSNSPFAGYESQAKAVADQARADYEARPEEVRRLPELGNVKADGVLPDLGRQLKMMLATDPAEQAQIAQASIEGSSIRQAEDGSWIIEWDQDGKRVGAVVNKPGMSMQDTVSGMAQLISYIPAARLTALGRGLFSRVGRGAATTAVTEAALQAAQGSVGGEFSLEDVGTAALFGAGAELAAPVLKGIWARLDPERRAIMKDAKTLEDLRKAGIATEDELKRLQQSIAKGQASSRAVEDLTGIEPGLFKAQMTLNPSDLSKQKFLRQLDASAEVASEGLAGQNRRLSRITKAIVDRIAPEEAVETAAARIRQAAKDAIAAKRLIQIEASSPIYKQAFRRQRDGQDPLLDMSRFAKKYAAVANQYDPTNEITPVLRSVVARVEAAKGDLFKLHNVKLHVDNLLEKTGENSLGRTSKRFLSEMKQELLGELTAKSPSYRAAISEFKRTQGDIDPLLNSAIGKIAKLDDDELSKASRAIFDRSMTPDAIARTRRVIESRDPQAWREIVRREIYDRLSGIESLAKDQGADQVENLPGKLLSALYGNPQRREVLLQAVDLETRKNLLFLEDVLRRGAAGRAEGSPTGIRNVIVEQLRGGLGVARDLFSNTRQTLANLGEGSLFNRRVKALADVMYDPQFSEEMARIRRLGAESRDGAKRLEDLLGVAMRASVQTLNDDDAPRQPIGNGLPNLNLK